MLFEGHFCACFLHPDETIGIAINETAVIGQQRLYGLVQKNTSLGTYTSPQAHLGTSVQFQEVFAFLVRHLHAVVSGQEAGENLQAGVIEQLRETFVTKDILY